jgi:hypothetical protein
MHSGPHPFHQLERIMVHSDALCLNSALFRDSYKLPASNASIKEFNNRTAV